MVCQYQSESYSKSAPAANGFLLPIYPIRIKNVKNPICYVIGCQLHLRDSHTFQSVSPVLPSLTFLCLQHSEQRWSLLSLPVSVALDSASVRVERKWCDFFFYPFIFCDTVIRHRPSHPPLQMDAKDLKYCLLWLKTAHYLWLLCLMQAPTQQRVQPKQKTLIQKRTCLWHISVPILSPSSSSWINILIKLITSNNIINTTTLNKL